MSMRGWIELCSDVNWEDYHGMWAKKARDGSWFVLVWQNLWDAVGEDEAKSSGLSQYECQVKRLDLKSVDPTSALKSCGYEMEGDKIVAPYSGDVVAEGETVELCLVEVCIQHGLGAPLHEEYGSIRPTWIRAAARRVAEELMHVRGSTTLSQRMSRRVNAIGSTAEEYGRGDIDAALHRARGPAADLMRKIEGVPPIKTGVAYLRTCPFSILLPEHYDDNGVCKCRDAAHRAMMIKEWDYTAQDFIGKGVL